GGLVVGIAGLALASSSQSKLDALASPDTVSGYPEGDYACRDVASDACPPTLESQIRGRKAMGGVGLAVGSGLLIGGAALIVLHVTKNKQGSKQARLDGLGPVIGPGEF